MVIRALGPEIVAPTRLRGSGVVVLPLKDALSLAGGCCYPWRRDEDAAILNAPTGRAAVAAYLDAFGSARAPTAIRRRWSLIRRHWHLVGEYRRRT